MPLIEARLLITMTAVTLVITAAAVVLAWVTFRRVYGVGYWSLGFMHLAAGSFLHSFQGLLDPLFSIGLANTLIGAGFLLTWSGARAFQRRAPLSPWLGVAIIALIILTHMVAGLQPAGFVARAIVVSLTIGVTGLLIAREMLHSPTGIRPMSDTLSGLLFLLLGLSFMLRALSAPLVEPVHLIVDEAPFNHTTFALAIVFNTLIAFAYLIMLTERHNARIPRLVDTDVSTGLYNEEGLKKAASRLFSRSDPGGRHNALLLLDLPWLNSAQGEVDTRLLERLVTLFNKTLRDQDLVGHLNGGQFVACLSVRREEDARQIQARIDASLDSIADELGIAPRRACSELVVAGQGEEGEFRRLLNLARHRLRVRVATSG